MDYPVSKLGKVAVVWAQGDGDIVSGMPETVGDAEFLAFAGVSPAALTADPATIIGNTTQPVTVCVTDGLGAGVGGIYVGFSYESSEAGTVTVNGVPGPGIAPVPTSLGTGCVTLNVSTAGVLGTGTITFTGAGASDTVDVVTGVQVLFATPSRFSGETTGLVTLSLRDANGVPVSGVQLVGNCDLTPASNPIQTPTASTAPAPGSTGITDSNGQAVFSIVALGVDSCTGTPGEASCTYTTLFGSPTAVVDIVGRDIGAFSPDCP